MLVLCLQRILVDDYPCLLNMWSGFIGTVVLFNAYLWRCWQLFFIFNLTNVRLQAVAAAVQAAHASSHMSLDQVAEIEAEQEKIRQNNFFIKNRKLIDPKFLARLSIGSFFILMIAPLIGQIDREIEREDTYKHILHTDRSK